MSGTEQSRRDFPPAEMRWTAESLQQELLNACTREPYRSGIVSFDQLPRVIEVNDSVHAAVACVAGSAIDGKERGVSMLYDPLTRVIAHDRQVTIGDEKTVSFSSFPTLSEKEMRRRFQRMPLDRALMLEHVLSAVAVMGPPEKLADRLTALMSENTPYGALCREAIPRVVGNIHSHPIVMPVSYIDIAMLLSQPAIKQMTIGLSDGRVEMLLKATDTAVLSKEQLAEKTGKWAAALEARISEARPKTESQWLDFNFRAQRALARGIASKYKLGYYEGGKHEDLKRIT